jgi:hypothetical protein
MRPGVVVSSPDRAASWVRERALARSGPARPAELSADDPARSRAFLASFGRTSIISVPREVVGVKRRVVLAAVVTLLLAMAPFALAQDASCAGLPPSTAARVDPDGCVESGERVSIITEGFPVGLLVSMVVGDRAGSLVSGSDHAVRVGASGKLEPAINTTNYYGTVLPSGAYSVWIKDPSGMHSPARTYFRVEGAPALPTATPAPTEPPPGPGPTPDPIGDDSEWPSSPPTRTGDPIELSGTGQTVTDPFTLPSTVSRVTASHEGDSNFTIRAFGPEGREKLLVNVIGPFEGEALLMSESNDWYLEVSADGDWSITVDFVGVNEGVALGLDGLSMTVTGLFTPLGQGPAPFRFTHDGESNFAVWLRCAGGNHLVQNEIGPVDNEAVAEFSEGPCLWEIIADGEWTIRREGCDPSYPDFCIPPPPPDLSCNDFEATDFTVYEPDPHGLDGDNNGVGCQTGSGD